MQGGQLVAGFNKWKDTFHRTVKKGVAFRNQEELDAWEKEQQEARERDLAFRADNSNNSKKMASLSGVPFLKRGIVRVSMRWRRLR